MATSVGRGCCQVASQSHASSAWMEGGFMHAVPPGFSAAVLHSPEP